MSNRKSNAPIPVAVYARYSTMMQDSRSIDDQVRRCEEYAKRNGMEVIATYDKAESGSHMEREGVQRLLTAARAKPIRFERVLVDDLSRLSRDLGNTWQVIYGDFASLGIYVIDVSSGVSSESDEARLMIATKGAFNDHFLQTVRKMTHRGLEGRALAGFWAGGRVYGYRTIVEPNPPDPEHPRKIPVTDEEQAALVRRIFRMWVNGESLKVIASTLNEEGIAAPNDGGRGNKIGRGWGHTTIREMLLNDRYIGRLVWNKWKWQTRPAGRAGSVGGAPRVSGLFAMFRSCHHRPRALDGGDEEIFAPHARTRSARREREASLSDLRPSPLRGLRRQHDDRWPQAKARAS